MSNSVIKMTSKELEQAIARLEEQVFQIDKMIEGAGRRADRDKLYFERGQLLAQLRGIRGEYLSRYKQDELPWD